MSQNIPHRSFEPEEKFYLSLHVIVQLCIYRYIQLFVKPTHAFRRNTISERLAGITERKAVKLDLGGNTFTGDFSFSTPANRQ